MSIESVYNTHNECPGVNNPPVQDEVTLQQVGGSNTCPVAQLELSIALPRSAFESITDVFSSQSAGTSSPSVHS